MPPLETLEGSRQRRLRAPLLLTLWLLLAFEAGGGLVLFVARLISGTLPGETAHVVAGVALTAIYAIYQWRHWRRVRPLRPRLHDMLGLIAAIFMGLCNLSGIGLAVIGWSQRFVVRTGGPVGYPPLLSGVHNVTSMVVLTFVGAHVGAVLLRDRGRSS